MEIRINTSDSSEGELTALIALLASLGGRLPNHHVEIRGVSVTAEDLRTIEHAEINQGRRGPPLGVVEAGEPADVTASTNDSPVDSKGTPWDARIHSESKAINADKTWRKRRGVSDEMFNDVMSELHAAALVGHPDEADAPPPPPADEEPEVPLAPADDSVPAPPAPTEDAPTAPEPAASAPVAGSDGQFASFAEFVAAVAKHGKTYVELNEMAATVGVPAFKDLKDHADKWDMFFAMA